MKTPSWVTTIVLAVWTFGATMALGMVYQYRTVQASELPACQFEDGNTNGKPCNWVDPDTGITFYVSSENYR